MPDDLPAPVHNGAAVFNRGDALLAIDLVTGRPRWKHPVHGAITWGPVERDGVAYVIAYDVDGMTIATMESVKSYLYAIDVTKASLLDAPEDEAVETAK